MHRTCVEASVITESFELRRNRDLSRREYRDDKAKEKRGTEITTAVRFVSVSRLSPVLTRREKVLRRPCAWRLLVRASVTECIRAACAYRHETELPAQAR
jgi:hypothetical protein